MALTLRFFTCLVLTVCIVASVDAAISCGTVIDNLTPCVIYLRTASTVTGPCCAGVKMLNNLVQTTLDRQIACRCLQSLAKVISPLDPSKVFGLPGKCGISFPYPISMSTICANIN